MIGNYRIAAAVWVVRVRQIDLDGIGFRLYRRLRVVRRGSPIGRGFRLDLAQELIPAVAIHRVW